MFGLSEGIGPWLTVREGLLLLQAGSHLGEFLIVQSDFEFLGDVLVLVAIWFVVLAPLWEVDCFSHEDALLDEL